MYRCSILLSLAFAVACAHRHPLPVAYAKTDAATLLARMHDGHSAVARFSAEARLTSFGSSGRVRGTASVVVERPDHLRYDLQGPHGGTLVAAACDGQKLQVLRLTENRFDEVPATADNLDRMLGLVPMHRSAAGWVALLFGEIEPPLDATLGWDESAGAFVLEWQETGQHWRVTVDPDTARSLEASVWRDGELVTIMTIRQRDPQGLPVELRLAAPASGSDVTVKLRDIDTTPPIAADTFVLTVPKGMSKHDIFP